MKKIFIFLICCLLICGCSNKKEDQNKEEKKEQEFILEKIDNKQDYIYLQPYHNLIVNGDEYILNYLIVNIKSDDVQNVNLELRSFVTKSYQNMIIENNELKQGNVVDYKYYKTDEYISILQLYYPYINGVYGEESSNIYVISLKSGEVLSNEEILNDFNISEDELFDKIEENIDSEDVLYSMMNIKEEGYSLYVNSDNKLVVSYYEVNDENSVRKELVL